MMIKETAPGFTTTINPGRLGYIITMDKYGVDIDYKEIANLAKYFSYIVINGDEPFEQKEDIAKLIKKIAKENPNVSFDIYCKGVIKPVSVGGVNNINYYVELQLKRTNIQFDKRIKANIINWFYQANANFVFTITNEDELDEVEMLLSDYAIPKSKVFIGPNHNNKMYWETLKYVLTFAKLKGINYFFDTDKMLGDIYG